MSEQDIPVSEHFEPAPGVVYEEETPVEQAAPVQAEVAPEPTVEPATPAAEPEKPTEVQRPQKAAPIANLLSKKHELESQLEQERQAKAELEAKIAQLSQQPHNAQTNDKVKAFAEANGIDETIVNGLVQLAREGLSPQLPKEVKDLLEEREMQKQTEAEQQAFNKRLDSLAKTFKDESLRDPQVREKLFSLAYSTDNAPDGEPYHQKELAELYFGYIKPEIEPGRASAESSRGGTQTTKLIDFEEIARRDDPKEIEAMDDATFKQFTTWEAERNGKTPLRRL